MEDWKDWLENKMRRGDVCYNYMRAISSCKNRQQFFELCLDVNGMDFLCDMSKSGDLPYDSIKQEYARYINGQYVRKGEDGHGYTSEMWIDEKDREIEVSTTAIMFMRCKNVIVKVPEMSICAIYVDSESKIDIDCPSTSRAYVYCFGDGKAYAMTGKNVDFISM